ncbi:MAG: ABC transporter ATP-binding protein [Campylobacterota bacterium]
MNLLEIKNLQKTFCKGGVCVAKEIDFSVKEGEIFTLMGKSGSGKSSLLRMICGFETPDGGEIVLDKKPLYSSLVNLDPKDRQLSIVFQNYALFPHLSVAKNILFGYEKAGQKRLKNLLQKTGIESIKDRYPHEISGGQQQRVALCRALIRQPKLLLLDEPFSSVDSQMRAILRDELQQMIKEFNITSIFVTHDREDAFVMSDRVALMANGEILQVGDVKTLYEDPVSKEAGGFLGTINSCIQGDKEILYRPNQIRLNKQGQMQAKVLQSTYHGFYYVNIVSLDETLQTIYTQTKLDAGTTVGYDIKRD